MTGIPARRSARGHATNSLDRPDELTTVYGTSKDRNVTTILGLVPTLFRNSRGRMLFGSRVNELVHVERDRSRHTRVSIKPPGARKSRDVEIPPAPEARHTDEILGSVPALSFIFPWTAASLCDIHIYGIR